MSMKENAGKSFCEVVRWVNGSANALENDEVPLDPITQREVFYVNVMRAWSGLLCIAHQCTTIVVFVSHGRCLLWNVKIPKNTANK